jgi:hypothetical protein
MNFKTVEYANYPNGNSDNIHLKGRGTKAVAQLFLMKINEQNIVPISIWIKFRMTMNLNGSQFKNRMFYVKHYTKKKYIDPYSLIGRAVVPLKQN